jgi:hypothetical protein
MMDYVEYGGNNDREYGRNYGALTGDQQASLHQLRREARGAGTQE